MDATTKAGQAISLMVKQFRLVPDWWAGVQFDSLGVCAVVAKDLARSRLHDR